MKSTFPLKAACLSIAMAAVSCVFAQEAAENSSESQTENAAEDSAGGAKAEAQSPEASAQAGKDFRFLPLMRCSTVQGGTAEVRLPKSDEWQPAVQGRYYPFGSAVRLSGASGDALACFEIGPKASVSLVGEGTFSMREMAIGEKTRAVLLDSGTLSIDLPRSLKDGLITVASPDFVCKNLAGESRFECTETVDGREVVVRVVTGSLALEGRHYSIAHMGVANQVRICTSPDALFTSLRGESGDYKVLLDCGVKSVLDPDTGKNNDVPQTIDYSLSPKCAIKIWRKVSEKSAGGSGRMAVAVQTFDAQGKDKNFRAFFENRSNVNSGELVVAPKEASKEEAEKNKSAAEDVEEVAAPASDSGEAAAATSSDGAASSSDGAADSAAAPAAADSAPAAGDGL